jgi:hypothetical protein
MHSLFGIAEPAVEVSLLVVVVRVTAVRVAATVPTVVQRM